MKNRMVNLSDTYQGQDGEAGGGGDVRETPNSDACADKRLEFHRTDASASVLHSLTPYFPIFEHGNI